MKRAALYARVSTDRQEAENQQRQLRAFVEVHEGWELVAEYRDEESGATGSRERFQDLFEDAHQRKFDVVVFWALDRFSREGTRATINYLHELESYGVRFISFTERYLDSTGLFRDALIGLLAALANQEKVRLSERVKAGMTRGGWQACMWGCGGLAWFFVPIDCQRPSPARWASKRAYPSEGEGQEETLRPSAPPR